MIYNVVCRTRISFRIPNLKFLGVANLSDIKLFSTQKHFYNILLSSSLSTRLCKGSTGGRNLLLDAVMLHLLSNGLVRHHRHTACASLTPRALTHDPLSRPSIWSNRATSGTVRCDTILLDPSRETQY